MAAGDQRPFLIASEGKEKCVLEIRVGKGPKAAPKPGMAVGINSKNRKGDVAPNQLWYTGSDGFIRSKINDFSLSVSGGSDKEIVTAIYSGDPRHQWLFDGNKIVNKMFCNECLTVKKKLVRVPDDADVGASEYEGNPLQHWKIEYPG